jgi:hypothetical protein
MIEAAIETEATPASPLFEFLSHGLPGHPWRSGRHSPMARGRRAASAAHQVKESRPLCQQMCRFLGRLHHKSIHALPRQASEKRQGTKSRAGRGSVSPLRSMGI